MFLMPLDSPGIQIQGIHCARVQLPTLLLGKCVAYYTFGVSGGVSGVWQLHQQVNA